MQALALFQQGQHGSPEIRPVLVYCGVAADAMGRYLVTRLVGGSPGYVDHLARREKIPLVDIIQVEIRPA